jgi:hypothetical protein
VSALPHFSPLFQHLDPFPSLCINNIMLLGPTGKAGPIHWPLIAFLTRVFILLTLLGL